MSLCDQSFVSGTLWPLVRYLDITKPSRRRRMLESALRCIDHLYNITSLSLKLRSISATEMKQVREIVPAVSDNLRFLYLNTRNSFCDATDLLPYVHLSKLKILIVDSRVPLTVEVLKSLPYSTLERLELPIDVEHFEYLLRPMPELKELQIRLEVTDSEVAGHVPEQLQLLKAAHPGITSLKIIMEYGMNAIFDLLGTTSASAENILTTWNEQIVFSPAVLRFNSLGLWQVALRCVSQPFYLDQFANWYRLTYATSTLQDKMEAILGALSADPDMIGITPENTETFFTFVKAELRRLLTDPEIGHYISTLPILDWTAQLATLFSSSGEKYQEEANFWLQMFKEHFRKTSGVVTKGDFGDYFLTSFSQAKPFMMTALDDKHFVQNSSIVKSLVLWMADQTRRRMYYGPPLRYLCSPKKNQLKPEADTFVFQMHLRDCRSSKLFEPTPLHWRCGARNLFYYPLE
jgi:hypothetical protein